MSIFRKNVLKIIAKIPYGKVASYGQIALYAGKPRAAREVGWILHQSETNPKIEIPWWRVVNNKGRVTIKGSYSNTPIVQQKLLIAEGIIFKRGLEFDIENYRWKT